ncbi:chorismate mutase [Streptomyces sp. NPDC004647]|uniref:chorismate mutase n=1 Tax=Streptomyces sp. NPDC004647 TaxID=3154671 RepID=UPI0033B08394
MGNIQVNLRNDDAPIESYRKEIDEIDTAVIELLQRRMQISERIQRRRMGGGGPRTVFSREMVVLNRYNAGVGTPGTTIAMSILELCRGGAQEPLPATPPPAAPAVQTSA